MNMFASKLLLHASDLLSTEVGKGVGFSSWGKGAQEEVQLQWARLEQMSRSMEQLAEMVQEMRADLSDLRLRLPADGGLTQAVPAPRSPCLAPSPNLARERGAVDVGTGQTKAGPVTPQADGPRVLTTVPKSGGYEDQQFPPHLALAHLPASAELEEGKSGVRHSPIQNLSEPSVGRVASVQVVRAHLSNVEGKGQKAGKQRLAVRGEQDAQAVQDRKMLNAQLGHLENRDRPNSICAKEDTDNTAGQHERRGRLGSSVAGWEHTSRSLGDLFGDEAEPDIRIDTEARAGRPAINDWQGLTSEEVDAFGCDALHDGPSRAGRTAERDFPSESNAPLLHKWAEHLGLPRQSTPHNGQVQVDTVDASFARRARLSHDISQFRKNKTVFDGSFGTGHSERAGIRVARRATGPT